MEKMVLDIIVYKDTGKYYTSEIVEISEDIPEWDDRYKDIIRKAVPANIGEGFILVIDHGSNKSFHNRLYRYNEIFK